MSALGPRVLPYTYLSHLSSKASPCFNLSTFDPGRHLWTSGLSTPFTGFTSPPTIYPPPSLPCRSETCPSGRSRRHVNAAARSEPRFDLQSHGDGFIFSCTPLQLRPAQFVNLFLLLPLVRWPIPLPTMRRGQRTVRIHPRSMGIQKRVARKDREAKEEQRWPC